jgi:hypothetical protein
MLGALKVHSSPCVLIFPIVYNMFLLMQIFWTASMRTDIVGVLAFSIHALYWWKAHLQTERSWAQLAASHGGSTHWQLAFHHTDSIFQKSVQVVIIFLVLNLAKASALWALWHASLWDNYWTLMRVRVSCASQLVQKSTSWWNVGHEPSIEHAYIASSKQYPSLKPQGTVSSLWFLVGIFFH